MDPSGGGREAAESLHPGPAFKYGRTREISTLDYIGDDPETAPLLNQILGPDGKPKVGERVWVSSLNGKMNEYGGEGFGRLTTGYGVRREDPANLDEFIGPECLFGITMEESYDGPISIIKTAWAGQSLSVDFRSPGSGPYVLNDWQVKTYTKRDTLEQVRTQKQEATSRDYRYMVDHIQMVLAGIKRVCPDYDPDPGYVLSGFVWFHGWNDFVDTARYPEVHGERQYEEYGQLLAQFVRDIRTDLKAPKRPLIVGVIGIYGNYTRGTFKVVDRSDQRMKRFCKAMEAPAAMAEFKGSVTAVHTAPFREDVLAFIEQKQLKVKAMGGQLVNKHVDSANADGAMTPEQRRADVNDYGSRTLTPDEIALWGRAISIGGFVHYCGSARFLALAGKAFAEALLEMDEK